MSGGHRSRMDKCVVYPLPALAPRLRGRLAAFARREDGAIMVFGVFVFILMVFAGGMAVDTMRHEERRTELQYTLDRAVLAASSLEQPGDPAEVVRNYVEAQGFDPDSLDITVEETLNSRRVTAVSREPIQSFFVQLLGVDEMIVPARSRAEDRFTDVEIAMILDVSGSMGSGDRLVKLKPAARDFVSAMLAGPARENTTISLVPYHSNVNVGAELSPLFGLDATHSVSHCAWFEDAQFNQTDLSDTTTLERYAHYDRFTAGRTKGLFTRPQCDVDTRRAVLPWSNDVAQLHARIESLHAYGNTSIDTGVKWGTILLDPSSQDELLAMRTAGLVSDDHADRPYAYDRESTAKYLVVMTDGANTYQDDLVTGRKNGDPSGVFVYTPDWTLLSDKTAIDGGDGYDASGNAQYTFLVKSRADAGITDRYFDPVTDTYRSTPIGGGDARELTYQQLYARLPARHVYNTMTAGMPQDDRLRYGIILETIGPDKADDRLADICAAARAQGVTIFTIGFEAPTKGVAALKTCASRESHHYDADTTDISGVFASIASTIQRLRLKQ